MKSSNILSLGNARKLKEHLSHILDQDAIDAIETEIERNSIKLYKLGLQHYRFAASLQSPHWRQKVSRLYYSSYATSRAVRLYVFGDHSTDVKDHKNVGHLPDDFPDRARFANKLAVLRADRNTCDYDHDSRVADLLTTPSEALVLVKNFLEEAAKYLKARGLSVRGRP